MYKSPRLKDLIIFSLIGFVISTSLAPLSSYGRGILDFELPDYLSFYSLSRFRFKSEDKSLVLFPLMVRSRQN